MCCYYYVFKALCVSIQYIDLEANYFSGDGVSKSAGKKTLVDLFTNIVFYKRHFYDWKKLFLIFAMQSIFLSFLVGFLWIPVHTSSHHAHDV